MGKRVGQIAKVPELKQSNSNSRVRRTEHLQSMDTPVDRILYLQRTAGNQAVQRLIKSGTLQTKLRIGQPLSENESSFFEPCFGRDFIHGRLHTDTWPAESARAVNTWAFTIDQDFLIGSNINFNSI